MKRSFFDKLTGAVPLDEGDELAAVTSESGSEETEDWIAKGADEGQLSVDMYQTANDIIVRAMIAGVRPDDVDIDIGRDRVIVRGERHDKHEVHDDDFYHRELYWGSFSRTIKLPAEIEPEEAEATEKHGLLTLRLPKIDKSLRKSVKVKSV